ncbi:phosphatase PAP2 family protein [Pedococcus sp. NPDC057267]|uniref:phosphatase PAP2 family protein n=1 Tax=Pedococcus sp. NPDC057267 TaxID=3346077 RepID=UPI003629F9CA
MGRDGRVGRPLMSGRSRARAASLLLVLAAVVVVLGALAFHQSRAGSLDRAVDAAVIAGYGGHAAAAVWLAAPGAGLPAALCTAAVALACLAAGRTNGAVLAVGAVCLSVGAVEWVLKPLVGRTYDGFLAFPSGHTTTVFALAASVGVLVHPSSTHGAWRSRTAVAAAVVLACVVASAVIALRWHYFTDTVAGAAVGVGTATGLALVLDTPVARGLIARAASRVQGRQGA